VQDRWKTIFIAFNGSNKEQQVFLPSGKWSTATNKNSSIKISAGKLAVDKYSAVILYKE
jgi:hypothetical protein